VVTVAESSSSPVSLRHRRMTDAEHALAKGIADTLDETEPEPRRRIARVVLVLGAARAEALIARAQAIEEAGGSWVRDGSRRRTPGGVFFEVVHQSVTTDERARIFSVTPRTGAQARTHEEWDAAIVGEIGALTAAETGEATSVKITVVGRPGKVVEREGVVAVALVSAGMPSLPKGLPVPGTTRTRYVVLIARKQWTKVAAALADPADTLIAEGYPALEERFAGAITVYATRVTTKQLQAAQKAETTANGSAASTGE